MHRCPNCGKWTPGLGGDFCSSCFLGMCGGLQVSPGAIEVVQEQEWRANLPTPDYAEEEVGEEET